MLGAVNGRIRQQGVSRSCLPVSHSSRNQHQEGTLRAPGRTLSARRMLFELLALFKLFSSISASLTAQTLDCKRPTQQPTGPALSLHPAALCSLMADFGGVGASSPAVLLQKLDCQNDEPSLICAVSCKRANSKGTKLHVHLQRMERFTFRNMRLACGLKLTTLGQLMDCFKPQLPLCLCCARARPDTACEAHRCTDTGSMPLARAW